jgi:hypothetical protein
VSTAASSVAGLLLALAGQARFDARPDKWFDPLVLYLLAAVCWWQALRRQPIALGPAARIPAQIPVEPGPEATRRRVGYLAGAVAIVAVCGLLWPAMSGPGSGGGLGFLSYPGGPASGANHLTVFGAAMWLTAVVLYVNSVAFVPRLGSLRRPEWLRRDRLVVAVPYETIALIGVMAIALWFRVADLASVPLEMTSDHTEKLTDI